MEELGINDETGSNVWSGGEGDTRREKGGEWMDGWWTGYKDGCGGDVEMD